MRNLPIEVQGRDPKLIRLLNDILAQLRAQRLKQSPTTKVNESAAGTTIEVKPGGQVSGDVWL
jgi:hypothetical protein